MSPPLFLLGSISILSLWLITSFGLPADLWTFGLIPVLSISLLCDHRKLRKVAAVKIRAMRTRIPAAATVTLVCTLFACVSTFHPLLWKLNVLLVWLFFMIKGFDFEKMMYMTDTCGAVAKSLIWNVITSFTGQAMWMTYKGEWAYCCPYTRELVRQEIDHYYTLQTKHEEHDDGIPESYDFNFHIGSCEIVCTYIPAGEDSGDVNADDNQATAVVSTSEESESSSTSSSLQHSRKLRADMDSAVYTTSGLHGEGSSTKSVPIIEDHYTLVPSHVNKLEISLKYENEPIESYTYYDRPLEAVAELKRALNVLKNEGNLIFSNLNRYSGSNRPQAHARCHEFRELLDSILCDNHNLHHVDLRTKYNCIISGHWLFPMLLLPILVWINYYQIVQEKAPFPVVIIVLALFIFFSLLCVLGEHLPGPQGTMRACVYCIIDWIDPINKDGWYRYFQVNLPCLTYGNESYGYPCRLPMKEVCHLGGATGRLPVHGGIESPACFHMDDLKEGLRVFDLKSLQVELIVTQVLHDPPMSAEEWQVDVQMFRRKDNRYCYREIFRVDRCRATNIVALMQWLQKNNCIGVCKEWPTVKIMYTYRYEELFHEILKKGQKPMVNRFTNPLTIRVE